MHIRSTGTERTILSATYFGLGLNSELKSGDLPILPAVFSAPKRYDGILKVSSPCPAFKKLARESVLSDLAINFAAKEKQFFQELSEFASTLSPSFRPVIKL